MNSLCASTLSRYRFYRVCLQKHFQVAAFHQHTPPNLLCSQLPLANRQANRRSAQAGSFGGLLHGEKWFVRRRLTDRIFDVRLDDRGQGFG